MLEMKIEFLCSGRFAKYFDLEKRNRLRVMKNVYNSTTKWSISIQDFSRNHVSIFFNICQDVGYFYYINKKHGNNVGPSNLWFSEFILINKTKENSSLCLLRWLPRTYDGRIRIEVTRTPSIRHIGGPPGSLESSLLDIFQSKKNWNFLTSISVLGL